MRTEALTPPVAACVCVCVSCRAPSPRALDEFDLSKSPALAVMSAAREGRVPAHNFRRVGQQQSPHHGTSSRHHRSSSSGARGSYSESAGLYTEMMGSLSITEEEHSSFSDDSADYNHHHQTQATQQRYRADDAFARAARERRSSYGSLSDAGDSGVFDFEEN